ncbi:uncharacterized protein LOC119079672 [Bradysia coprophila]|uniref:uncharacterized protein LOC119079672 n=1 Tax=Bradysia coprophila TaxID=38358 RepID=UPI00187D7A8B|nr:uncharacterized protein LOC119079672 [Bradysia coprophila]
MSVVKLLFYLLSFEISVCLSISIKSRCDLSEVCNVIHNRYWLPNLIEKQCMCPANTICPSTYSKREKPFTMSINSRTQMQLCRPTNASPIQMCLDQELSVLQKRTSKRIETKIICRCSRRSFLKFYAKVTNRRDKSITFKYRCVGMPPCHSDQLCGYARSDLGFVYQRCTCREGYNCVTKSSADTLNGKMHQLFYNGTVYPSYCVSYL